MPGPGSPQPQPSQHAGWCACPILAAHAEVERLAKLGLTISDYNPARTYVIAALRERHGCRRGQSGGPGWCYWADAVSIAGDMQFDNRVPLIRPQRPGENTGEYL